MTLKEFEKTLAIFCFCFGWLALSQGHSWIAAWLGRQNGHMYVPLRELPKAVMRMPKLQGLALTMNQIGKVLCGVGICMWLYEWAV